MAGFLPRFVVALVAIGLLAPAVALSLLAVGAPVWLAVGVAVLTFAAAPAAARRLPASLGPAAMNHRGRAILWCLVSLLALTQTVRLAVFMHDARRIECSALPWDTFWRGHSCFSAYFVAADRERRAQPNIYELGDAENERYGAAISPLEVDEFLYPPTFLPIPLAALRLTDDFFVLRRAWFGLELALLIAGILVVARFLGGRAGRDAALMGVALCAAPPVLLTLQIGNVQLAAFLLAMLGLVAIEKGRPGLGGTILGVLALAKIFPGVLAIGLLARCRWRALAAMCLASLALLAISALAIHGATFQAFVFHELPLLSHGDRFFAGLDPASRLRLAAVNFSAYGLVAKLRELGMPGLGPGVAGASVWIFSAVVLGLTWVAMARAQSPGALAQSALAALILAAGRSPFVPSAYGAIGALWLLTLLAAEAPASRRAIGWGLAFLALCYVVPDRHPGFPAPSIRLAVGLAQQIGVFALGFGVLVRHARHRGASELDETFS